MIGALKGRLDSAHEGGCVFDVNGVGYLLSCSRKTLDALAGREGVQRLLVETRVSVPLFQFILLRWYFRIFIWARFLWQVSRIDLAYAPAHPDRLGGSGSCPASVTRSRRCSSPRER